MASDHGVYNATADQRNVAVPSRSPATWDDVFSETSLGMRAQIYLPAVLRSHKCPSFYSRGRRTGWACVVILLLEHPEEDDAAEEHLGVL